MRRTMSFRQLHATLARGLDKCAFVVNAAIGDQYGVGDDVTAAVRSGEIPESALRTHVKRGSILVVPLPQTAEERGRVALLKAMRTGTRDVLRQALASVGVIVPPAVTTDVAKRIRQLVLQAAKAA